MACENPVVELLPWEYERGYQVGIARFTANWWRADAPHYDKARMEEDRNAQAAAALCEIAVAKYTNQYFHGHVWHWSEAGRYGSIADVGHDIEVRRVRTAGGVAVRRTDAGKIVWAARTVDREYRTIEILGWVAADDVIPTLGADGWGYFPIESLTRDWALEPERIG